MDCDKGTLTFFFNDVQQPLYISGINEKVRFIVWNTILNKKLFPFIYINFIINFRSSYIGQNQVVLSVLLRNLQLQLLSALRMKKLSNGEHTDIHMN